MGESSKVLSGPPLAASSKPAGLAQNSMDQQANILFPTATHWRPDALPNGFTGCSESDLLTESTGWNPAAWNSVHESEASWISHSLQSGHSCAPCFEADTPLPSPPWAENSDTASLSSTATGGLDLTTVAGTSEESTLGITHYNLPDSSFSSWEPGPYLLPQWDNPVVRELAYWSPCPRCSNR